MTRDELVAAYAAGQRIFIAADLRGMDLEGVDLRGIRLRDAAMPGVRLRGADLSGAGLEDADLRGADMTGANMPGADLGRVDLRGGSLGRVDARGARLVYTSLRGAILACADLSCADLDSANLRCADIRGADMTGAILRSADLRDVDPDDGLRAAWGRLSDDLTRDMMRYDAAQLPDGDALMSAWASGGPCPYDVMRDRGAIVPSPLGMDPVRALWSPGPVLPLEEIWQCLADEREFII